MTRLADLAGLVGRGSCRALTESFLCMNRRSVAASGHSAANPRNQRRFPKTPSTPRFMVPMCGNNAVEALSMNSPPG